MSAGGLVRSDMFGFAEKETDEMRREGGIVALQEMIKKLGFAFSDFIGSYMNFVSGTIVLFSYLPASYP